MLLLYSMTVNLIMICNICDTLKSEIIWVVKIDEYSFCSRKLIPHEIDIYYNY